MYLTRNEIIGLNIALNEAEFLGFEVDEERGIAAGTFNVLTLPETGPMQKDCRVSTIFKPVGRVVASLCNVHGSEVEEEPIPFEMRSLLEIVTSFGGLNIYGWGFLDAERDDQSDWMTQPSFDWISGDDGKAHSITLFQEGHDRLLFLRAWFDRIEIFDPHREPIALEDFIEGGRRWWEAFYAGDDRTSGLGMYRLKADASDQG